MKLPFYLLSIALILIAQTTSAQFSEYLYESNLNDNIGSNHGIYLDLGVPSGASPTYVAGATTGQRLELSPDYGVELPSGFNASIDTSKSLEIELDFSLTDLGGGYGRKYIFSCNQFGGANAAGFTLYANHDIFDPNPSVDIWFTYSDGGFGSYPEHPGNDNTIIGSFEVGDELNIRLILDFENEEWSSLINGQYTNKLFEQLYDWDIIKSAIKDYTAFIGWDKNLENTIPFAPNVFTGTGRFDNANFFSPKQVGNQSVLITALNAIEAHIDESNPLTNAQLDGYLVDIFLNYDGNYAGAETHIYSYIDAFELAYPPVFTNRNPAAISSLDVMSRAVIFLMQKIHDNQFVDGNMANVAGVAFETSEIFPGIVKAGAPRLSNQTVEVLAAYVLMPGARVVRDWEPVKRPTGFYAAPGEVVTITIDPAFVNMGLEAMVGSHDSDLSSQNMVNRCHRISKTYQLDSQSTDIANPFGGAIYIKVPEGTKLGWIDITIDGAVKSPYFSRIPGHETTPTNWLNAMADRNVEWADMESEKYMMTLPISHVMGITNPGILLDSLDSMQDKIRYVGGRPNERGRSEYFAIDSRLPNAAFGTGYPQIIGEYDAPYGPLINTEYYPTTINDPGMHLTDIRTTLHESGHGALHPTLQKEGETIIHLLSSYIFNAQHGLSIDMAFKYSMQEDLTFDEAAMDWMIAANFRTNVPMSCDPTMAAQNCDELRYQHRGHAKYIEMAKLFGWESVHGMNKVFYDEWTANPVGNNLVLEDEVIAAASAATGYNMAPLFHFWGVHPSAALADQLSYMPESPIILNQLLHYKSIVPANNAQFQPWYDAIRPQKDPVYYPRYDDALANYHVHGYAVQINDQIDFLIATYFGNNPCDSTLEFQEIIGTGYYQTNDWIKAPKKTYDDALVTMTATNFVELPAGFETTANVDLVVSLEGCLPSTVTDIDGNNYTTLTIGNQAWLGENLRVTKLNDGTPISQAANNSTWANLSTPGWCWYNNNNGYDIPYGKLYNFYAVDTDRLCPVGWHVPTREELTTMIEYLGGTFLAGGKLKETGLAHWSSPNTGATNETGFSGLGTGHRSPAGIYTQFNNQTWFWSSTGSVGRGYMRNLLYHSTHTTEYFIKEKSGASIRCIRD